jgi:hypothetical protein
MWGLHRKLHVTTNRREALAKVVTQALADRTALEDLESRLTALAAAESRSRDWLEVMAEIAEVLPSDAYLDAFHASGDTLVLAGNAVDASAAFAGLRKAALIRGIRANEPISRVVQDGGQTVERYSLTAQLVPVKQREPQAGGAP